MKRVKTSSNRMLSRVALSLACTAAVLSGCGDSESKEESKKKAEGLSLTDFEQSEYLAALGLWKQESNDQCEISGLKFLKIEKAECFTGIIKTDGKLKIVKNILGYATLDNSSDDNPEAPAVLERMIHGKVEWDLDLGNENKAVTSSDEVEVDVLRFEANTKSTHFKVLGPVFIAPQCISDAGEAVDLEANKWVDVGETNCGNRFENSFKDILHIHKEGIAFGSKGQNNDEGFSEVVDVRKEHLFKRVPANEGEELFKSHDQSYVHFRDFLGEYFIGNAETSGCTSVEGLVPVSYRDTAVVSKKEDGQTKLEIDRTYSLFNGLNCDGNELAVLNSKMHLEVDDQPLVVNENDVPYTMHNVLLSENAFDLTAKSDDAAIWMNSISLCGDGEEKIEWKNGVAVDISGKNCVLIEGNDPLNTEVTDRVKHALGYNVKLGQMLWGITDHSTTADGYPGQLNTESVWFRQ